MKPHLQCGEQQVSRSNLTKYCACHAGRLAYLVLITYETSFTMRGATGVTIQPHQILRLSRRKTHILSPHHIWNVIYSARSNRCHDPTSPNTAPATQNCIAKFLTKSLKTDETSFPMRGRSENDPTMIRAWSDHDPSMIRPWSDHENANRNPPRNRGYFSSSPRAFSIEKYNVSRPILHSNIHQVLRLPRKVTLELHQVLHLPRKVTLELHQVLHLPRNVRLEPHQMLPLPRKMTPMLDPRYIWNLISNARSNRCHDPTSPNTAPVTQKYVNIPSEKYIYVHIYVCICVYTYLCKMDERRSYASLSKKWMSTGIVLACHKNGWVPVLCQLVIKMDEYWSYAGLS